MSRAWMVLIAVATVLSPAVLGQDLIGTTGDGLVASASTDGNLTHSLDSSGDDLTGANDTLDATGNTSGCLVDANATCEGNLTGQLGDGSSSEANPSRACEPTEDGSAVLCPLPPICAGAFQGSPECKPPARCQPVDDQVVRCPPMRVQATTETEVSPDPADPLTFNPVTRASLEAEALVSARGQARADAEAAMEGFKEQLDALREEWAARIDELRERYEDGKDRLRAQYAQCLDNGTARETCHQRALDGLDALRASLHAERDRVRAELTAQAEADATAACERLADDLVATLSAHRLPPGALEHVLRPSELGLCDGLVGGS